MAVKGELEESSEFFLENDYDDENEEDIEERNKEEDDTGDEEDGCDVEAQTVPSNSPFTSQQWPQSFK